MATTIDPPIQPSGPPVETLGPQLVFPTTRHERIASPIGWPAIFAATAVAAGTWLVLHLLGVGIGMTAIDPDDPSSMRGAGIGTGVWSLIAPLIALFVGGLVAGRTAPTVNTWNAIIHAAAAWALTAIGTMLVLGMMLGALGRAAGSTAGAVADVAQGAGARVGEVAPALGIDRDDVVARINRKLDDKGLPRVTADQITAAIREAAQGAVRGRPMDRDAIVAITARHTRLSEAQAEQVADDIQREATRIQDRGRELASDAGETALEVAETTGKVVMGLSIAMLLALGAAMLGAVVAVRRERRDYAKISR